jgi:hypothetical protein
VLPRLHLTRGRASGLVTGDFLMMRASGLPRWDDDGVGRRGMATALFVLSAVACLACTAAFVGAGPAGAAWRVPTATATPTATASASKPGAPAAPLIPSGAQRAAGAGRYVQMYPGGGIYQYGDAEQMSPPALTLSAPVVAMAEVPEAAVTGTAAGGSGSGSTGSSGTTAPTGSTSAGYWLASADGEVTAVGGAPSYGSAATVHLYAPIIGMAPTPDGHGYWLVALDGGIFPFGDAVDYGSMAGHPLAEPIVGMAPTPDGHGYWLVAADGGIFTFGDAAFYGSMGAHHLAQPVVGMAATPDGHGYWLVAADGGIFTFGDAVFYGSLGAKTLQASVAGMAATPHGTGYWVLESNGTVFPFGSARSFGQPAGSPAAAPFKTIVPTPDGNGYSLLEPDGFNYTFQNPAPVGGYPKIVSAASSQIRPDPDNGYFCNPYGSCEPWCALFVTWAWQQGGFPIPSYAFVGNIYYWAAKWGRVLPRTAHAVPGDAVLYGTGPQSVSTALHTGIVAQVWPDGAVVTIEGDAGPGVTGHLAVVVNGPYLPQDATASADYPVFALAQP